MSYKIIITGATGTAGSAALHEALLHPAISKITILTRRPLPAHVYTPTSPPDPRVAVVLQEDFGKYDERTMERLKGHDGVVWDLGISANGMKESDYSVITVDYTIAAAKAFSSIKPDKNEKFVFSFLSGSGAHQDNPSSSWTMFGRVKGIAEASLSHLPSSSPSYTNFQPYIFRPAGIIPSIPNPNMKGGIKLLTSILPAFKFLAPSLVIDARVLARAQLESIFRGGKEGGIDSWIGKGGVGDKAVFENEEIKKLAGEGTARD